MTARTSGSGESASDGPGRGSEAGPAVDETPTDGSPRGRPVADETPTEGARIGDDPTEAPASPGIREPAATGGEPEETRSSEAGGERVVAPDGESVGSEEPGEPGEPDELAEEDRGPLDRDAVRRVVGATTAVIASGDRHGEHDVSVLAGPTCFVRVLDGAHLAFPDEGAEPVTALRANLAEAPGVAMLLVGPGGAGGRRGLHLNGTAEVVPAEALREQHPDLPGDPVPGRATDVWVVVEVGDAYPLDDGAVPPLGPGAAPAPGDRKSVV